MGESKFWLSDKQFEKIKPHFPTDMRGKKRVDDRRVISGIVHILQIGGRWVLEEQIKLLNAIDPLMKSRENIITQLRKV